MNRKSVGTTRALAYCVIASLLAIVVLPAAAQQSASYRLDEHTFNAGGRPLDGSVASSSSYSVSLDAIGSPFAGAGALSGPNYRMDTGFIPTYPPPGEVDRLWFAADRDTLHWSPEPTVGDYSLYRDGLSALNGSSWGSCLETELTSTSTADPTVPSSGGGFYYLVAARNRLVEEGPLGSTSAGVSRIPASMCP